MGTETEELAIVIREPSQAALSSPLYGARDQGGSFSIGLYVRFLTMGTCFLAATIFEKLSVLPGDGKDKESCARAIFQRTLTDFDEVAVDGLVGKEGSSAIEIRLGAAGWKFSRSRCEKRVWNSKNSPATAPPQPTVTWTGPPAMTS